MSFQTGLGKGRPEKDVEHDEEAKTIFCRICKEYLPPIAYEPQRRKNKVSSCSKCRREAMYAKVR